MKLNNIIHALSLSVFFGVIHVWKIEKWASGFPSKKKEQKRREYFKFLCVLFVLLNIFCVRTKANVKSRRVHKLILNENLSLRNCGLINDNLLESGSRYVLHTFMLMKGEKEVKRKTKMNENITFATIDGCYKHFEFTFSLNFRSLFRKKKRKNIFYCLFTIKSLQHFIVCPFFRHSLWAGEHLYFDSNWKRFYMQLYVTINDKIEKRLNLFYILDLAVGFFSLLKRFCTFCVVMFYFISWFLTFTTFTHWNYDGGLLYFIQKPMLYILNVQTIIFQKSIFRQQAKRWWKARKKYYFTLSFRIKNEFQLNFSW